ncbi:hypothetical protein DER29_2558 [Micromonospora sp. M71_S20]|uniref:hypothetical protein n=1 Tax=Micromonospora sp. M71_S20 TaxID=592872 RepID=UPI000EAD67D4|nr:hypothetical protein [Micromonospora sp. M71_S20]RLK24641.1 hypothetical protein DER29_2558 [Micromonospora sp. M71_S20]
MIEPPLTGRQWRRRATIAAAVVFAVACIGAPVRQAVTRAIEAGRGEKTPAAAAEAYLLAVFQPDDNPDINRCLCGDNRDELFRQVRDLRKQVESRVTFGVRIETTNWQTDDSDGTVSAMVDLRFTEVDPSGSVTFTGATHRWRFHTTEEGGISGGWKVCRVDAPPLCGTYLRC